LKRKVINELILWKDTNHKKPFLLTGAKGVGKTYLAYDFAKAFFERIFYINFEREIDANIIFAAHEDEDRIINNVLSYLSLQKDTLPGSRILILDEIYLTPDTVYNLTLLMGRGIFPYIISISSTPVPLEIRLLFEQQPVFPMDFDEFLLATGNEWYKETIVTHFESNKKIPDIVHKELLALHRLYLQIGGMPGIINEYMSLSSLINVPEQHSHIISAYHDYILKDIPEGDALRMNQVFDSLALQLTKENKKFQYKLIRKGTTHSMYKEAIEQLIDRNYVIESRKISNEQLQTMIDCVIPEETSDESNTNFKLYMPDTGMLYTKMLEEKGIHFDQQIDKALIENFVAQSLHNKGYELNFWESESMAKIDFIIYKEHSYLPIEIHCGDSTRSKSISVLKQRCDFPYAVKISTKNFSFSNDIKYVPYYAVFCL
jgi:predicted AAA+ superfamily ATPase